MDAMEGAPQRRPGAVELGNLKILNVTRTIDPSQEEDYSFAIPAGGVGELRESTFHLKRSEPLSCTLGGTTHPAPGENGNIWTSEDVVIKSLEVVKQGQAERTNLLSGSPNIKEFAGNGMLSKLFTVVEVLENNEDVIIKVRNDDTVEVRVSLTLWIASLPRERRIAAQPAERTRAVDAEVWHH